ncbi:MAG: 4-(cytidine 5'-diphospho)-2-C-methyl-D-erythritol kinase [Acidobacteriales bacterium]|nr:4-(cytidine 5'-diphospho)-2-C-methyl-D-erythritol kinase [Terriglobales bacterium]
MPTSVRSYGKINIGLLIGPTRADGFHELRTCYTTIALYDSIKVERQRGIGIEIRTKGDHELTRRIPCDESNTCHRTVERLLRRVRGHCKIVITIEKRLPVQGGMGAASSNAVAALLAAERELDHPLDPEDRYAICAEVGSDLPQFLFGGLTLGIGRGEQVFPLPDLPPTPAVIVTPATGISTPQAFADWDKLVGSAALTDDSQSSKLELFSRAVYRWLSSMHSGVSPAGGNRAEAPLLDLVRTGIVNDFERVVFPSHPELREIKRSLERARALYASLSGSGSTLFGLFATSDAAERAAADLSAYVTQTLPRADYWNTLFT